MYKAYFSTFVLNIRDCDIFKKPNHVYSTRNNMLVQPKYLGFNNGIHAFRYEGARLWISLDPRVKEVNSVTDFEVR